jgi:hypothetical protein
MSNSIYSGPLKLWYLFYYTRFHMSQQFHHKNNHTIYRSSICTLPQIYMDVGRWDVCNCVYESSMLQPMSFSRRISATEGWYLHCGSQGATSCRVHAYWACRHGSRPCRPSHSSSTSSPRRPPWIVIATWPVFASPSSSFSPIAEIATLR